MLSYHVYFITFRTNNRVYFSISFQFFAESGIHTNGTEHIITFHEHGAAVKFPNSERLEFSLRQNTDEVKRQHQNKPTDT